MSVQATQAYLALIKDSVLIQLDAARAVYEDAVASQNIYAMGNAEITLG
jgi:hypothetical protein